MKACVHHLFVQRGIKRQQLYANKSVRKAVTCNL